MTSALQNIVTNEQTMKKKKKQGTKTTRGRPLFVYFLVIVLFGGLMMIMMFHMTHQTDIGYNNHDIHRQIQQQHPQQPQQQQKIKIKNKQQTQIHDGRQEPERKMRHNNHNESPADTANNASNDSDLKQITMVIQNDERNKMEMKTSTVTNDGDNVSQASTMKSSLGQSSDHTSISSSPLSSSKGYFGTFFPFGNGRWPTKPPPIRTMSSKSTTTATKKPTCKIVFRDEKMHACHLGAFGGNFGDMLGPTVVRRILEYAFSSATRKGTDNTNGNGNVDVDDFECSADELPILDLYQQNRTKKDNLDGPCFWSVGSVLRHAREDDHIWGTGSHGRYNDFVKPCYPGKPVFRNVTIYSVRGPKTVDGLYQYCVDSVYVYDHHSSSSSSPMSMSLLKPRQTVQGQEDSKEDNYRDHLSMLSNTTFVPAAGDGGFLIPFLFPELGSRYENDEWMDIQHNDIEKEQTIIVTRQEQEQQRAANDKDDNSKNNKLRKLISNKKNCIILHKYDQDTFFSSDITITNGTDVTKNGKESGQKTKEQQEEQEARDSIDSTKTIFLPVIQERWEYMASNITNNCHMVSSSSLHGLILADAYGIPTKWIRREQSIVQFKFRDYRLSYGLERETDTRQERNHHKYSLVQVLKFVNQRPKPQSYDKRSEYARQVLSTFPIHLFTTKIS